MESLSYTKYKVKQVALGSMIKDAHGYNCTWLSGKLNSDWSVSASNGGF